MSQSIFYVIVISIFFGDSSSEVTTFAVILLFAQKVELVKLGLVEPGLLDGEEGGCVLVREPDPVALVVDHPRCLFWRSNRVPRQPMCVFCSVDNCVGGGRLQAAANSRGVSGAGGDNKYVRHAWTARFLGQAGVGHVAAAVNA